MTLSDRGISIEKCLSFVQQLIDEDIIAYITNIKNVKRLLYSHSYSYENMNIIIVYIIDPNNGYDADVDI